MHALRALFISVGPVVHADRHHGSPCTGPPILYLILRRCFPLVGLKLHIDRHRHFLNLTGNIHVFHRLRGGRKCYEVLQGSLILSIIGHDATVRARPQALLRQARGARGENVLLIRHLINRCGLLLKLCDSRALLKIRGLLTRSNGREIDLSEVITLLLG